MEKAEEEGEEVYFSDSAARGRLLVYVLNYKSYC